jgi:hypothetical protein
VTASETLVTDDLIRLKGKWWPSVKSFPVTESDIRKYAIAIYWPDEPPRLFWDKQYAQTTRWKGIVAPEDFNPFAWQVGRPAAGPGQVLRPGEVKAKGGMNGAETDTFFERIHPGNVVTERIKLIDFYERTGPTLGLMLFEIYEIEWYNQNGTLIKRRIQTMLRYGTQESAGPASMGSLSQV